MEPTTYDDPNYFTTGPMKRPLGTMLLAAVTSLPTFGLAEAGPGDARQQELIYLLHQDCGSCHGMRLTGGLGPSLLAADMRNKPDSYLRHVIGKGIADTAMPPWEPILSPQEINFLITVLKHPRTEEQP
jgi:cytochrome c55X